MPLTKTNIDYLVNCKYCGSQITEPMNLTWVDQRSNPNDTKHLCKVCGMVFFVESKEVNEELESNQIHDLSL